MKSVWLLEHRAGWICAFLLASELGCGKAHELDTARVHGQVTIDGKPYTQRGVVMFQPRATGKMATGQIQADGTYELSTYSPGDGAIVGPHLVMLLPPAEGGDSPEDEQATVTTRSPIPAKYGTTATSGLICDVKSGQQNEFPIDMLSK